MRYSKYNEQKRQDRVAFPIELYNINEAHPQYVMPLHWHKELEIIRILSGSFTLYVDNIKYTLCEGDIAFINCGLLHRGEPTSCCYECVVCDLSMMIQKSNAIYSAYIHPIMHGNLLIQPVFHQADKAICQTVNHLFAQLSSLPEYYELGTMGLLFKLFEQLYCSGSVLQNNVAEKPSARTSIMSELVNWIECNYTEHITLQSLSEKAGISANYLCKVFKEYTGKTPIEYVNSIRIENICYEIKWGQKNITEAAINNGYNDLSYFCKVFKKYKGISAKKYAKQVENVEIKSCKREEKSTG